MVSNNVIIIIIHNVIAKKLITMLSRQHCRASCLQVPSDHVSAVFVNEVFSRCIRYNDLL